MPWKWANATNRGFLPGEPVGLCWSRPSLSGHLQDGSGLSLLTLPHGLVDEDELGWPRCCLTLGCWLMSWGVYGGT